MIRVIDKYIGKTDHPNYIHCETNRSFVEQILLNSVPEETLALNISNTLKSTGVIDESENQQIYFGGNKALSIVEDWNAETQTLTRERVFESREIYDVTQSLIEKIDYSLFLDDILFDLQLISIEEI